MAYIGMADTVMAYVAMACRVTAYIVMAYIVTAYRAWKGHRERGHGRFIERVVEA